ncbi:hypothetical protein [Algivirga pacifica]|uniref:Uncharacterized protein n=1 Tax=Algivirga pacifica TaxID=1162670 RepID=A0ABP9DIR9_9BACT
MPGGEVIFIILIIFVAGSLGFFLMEQSSKKYASALRKISNTEVIELIRKHRGQIGMEEFVRATGLSKEDAKYKLSSMLTQRILTIEYNERFETVYALSDIVKSTLYDVNSSYEAYKKTLKHITDAEIIRIALENKGRISPSVLCVKGKVSFDSAKDRLEELHEKGVMYMDVSDKGSIYYTLVDMDLFGKA